MYTSESRYREHFVTPVSYDPKAALAKVDEIIEANKRAFENRMGNGLGLGFEISDYRMKDVKENAPDAQESHALQTNEEPDVSINSNPQERSMSADSVPTLVSDSEESFSTDESLVITPDRHVASTIRPVDKKQCERPIHLTLRTEGGDEEEEAKENLLDGEDLAKYYRSHSRQGTPTSPTPQRRNVKMTKDSQESKPDSNAIYSSFVAARRSKWLDKKATIQRSLSIQTPSKPSTIELTKPIKNTIKEEDEESENLDWLVPLIQHAMPSKRTRPPPIWAQYAKVKGLSTDDNSQASTNVHSVLDRPRPRTSSYAFGSGTVKTDTSRKCSEKTSVVAMKKAQRKPDARDLFGDIRKDEELPFPSSYASLPMGPMPSVDRRSTSSTGVGGSFERLPKDRSVTPSDLIKKRSSMNDDPTVRLVGYKHGVDLSRQSSTATMPLLPESQALRDLENMLVAYTEDEVLMRLSNMFQVY
ncbi:hypothetical protein E3Q17_03545 [Wallemia mellicola]|uniref:Uncharacterized protein n=1 Tax=Wallemia mellicola TaxID=1708541 RepID=A0A4T0RMR2_9BASI|nr:hypothetical protein E3Q21_03087 [Wallemia mellicola]TIB85813.1 hypothetical protein E3Q20_03078 [Wallemia mellicola]TIB97128.1 hypothetical protein E3Q17_03545 [Wallemia mellicola]TIC21976.1 hypothetical protein E3Q12_03031 [Wallemia mellicola]TIC34073.1 hypothetical protein E3Q09_03152 [Wallemia mellicola]